MAVAFYDNRALFGDPGKADIDRVYRLDWHHFGDRRRDPHLFAGPALLRVGHIRRRQPETH